jgi:hypothetical protein
VLTTYVVPGERSSPRFGEAFAAGAGGRLTAERRLEDGDIAMFGSAALWDVLVQAIHAGRNWYYGDHAYFHRDMVRGDEKLEGKRKSESRERLRALGVNIKPWRRGGRHVLVCPPGQVHAHLMRRAGIQVQEAADWGAWACRELARHTDRPIKIRTKRRFQAGEPLSADLRDCWAVVCFMSNVGVEAALAGVPVFVLGPAAGRTMGCDDLAQIESPIYPDNRHDVACVLAANQWTLDEIAAGRAMEALH